MNRLFMVAVVLLGACSTVDLRDDPKDSSAAASSPDRSPSGPGHDEATSVASEALSGKPTPSFCVEGDLNCCGNGICEAGVGESCSRCQIDCGSCCGNGVCDANETCSSCPSDCSCGSTCNGTPGQWAGCRGNGCAVCAEKVSGAPCYFHNHPDCDLNTTCAGQFFTCNAACPTPSSADLDCNSCGACPPPCGNGICDAGETPATCPSDCGSCGHCADGSVCCGFVCADNSFCI